jgi:hypothetical protein
MRVNEYSDGNTFALTISAVPGDVDDFANELKEIKATLCDWKNYRRQKCDLVVFVVLSNPKNHAEIESMLKGLCRKDTVLAPLLQSVKVQLNLMNEDAQSIKDYVLE